jgi:hopene-associated glycosyltransferase HpnB
MSLLLLTFIAVTSASLIAWLYLLLARGSFWRTDIKLTAADTSPSRDWPSVGVVVPAREEASVLPQTLTKVLGQEYPGKMLVYLVDDQSRDGTASVARSLAEETEEPDLLTVVEGIPLPTGWAGKVWAMEQGVRAAGRQLPEFLWLTDADIAHNPRVLQALIVKAESDGADLVSVAARLHCHGFWERLLVPAFIYFFAKLFPFRWVNDPKNPTAAAAGGCVLVRREALESAGGLASIAGAIIDDCALAGLVKGRGQGVRIWLGLSHDVMSVRPYDGLSPFWGMVARTAYTQLRYSPVLLVGTLVGMTLVYIVPPAALIGGRAALWVTGESN